MKASLASGIEDLVSFVITLFRALFVDFSCIILVVHDLRFFLLVGYQVPQVMTMMMVVLVVLHLVVASVVNRLIF